MPTVKSNGININYEECGNGEPLLLIMGISAPGAAWTQHVNEYKKYFRCIILDNRGAGASDKPAGNYTTELMASDSVNVMDALGIGRFHVNGISMGGAIAQQIALAHPARVKSCVMTATWAFCNNYMKSVFDVFKTTRRKLSPGDFAPMFLLWLYSAKFFGDNPGLIEEITRGNASDPSPMPHDAFDSQAAACVAHDLRGKLGGITTPVLLTTGSKDIFVPMENSQYLHENIKNSTLEVFEGYSHVHHWEDLERYNRVTTDFLKKHNG
jgi:pimeloyl-ACP methyl ester carboxylesterase